MEVLMLQKKARPVVNSVRKQRVLYKGQHAVVAPSVTEPGNIILIKY